MLGVGVAAERLSSRSVLGSQVIHEWAVLRPLKFLHGTMRRMYEVLPNVLWLEPWLICSCAPSRSPSLRTWILYWLHEALGYFRIVRGKSEGGELYNSQSCQPSGWFLSRDGIIGYNWAFSSEHFISQPASLRINKPMDAVSMGDMAP